MFDSNSRYVNCRIVEVNSPSGDQHVNVVALRRLPYTEANLVEVKGTDRLDISAHRRYKDATKFWHIADANTELQANDLVEKQAPENPLAKRETPFMLIPKN